MRKTLAENGFHDADVVKYEDPTGKHKWNYLVRVGAVSVGLRAAGEADPGVAGEGRRRDAAASSSGPRAATRSTCATTRPVEPTALPSSLKAIGVSTTQVQPLRPPRGQHLRGDAGRPRQRDPPRASTRSWARARCRRSRKVESVGAKAGKQLQVDGVESLLYAILLHHGVHRVPVRLPLRPGHGRRAAPRRGRSRSARSRSPTRSSR